MSPRGHVAAIGNHGGKRGLRGTAAGVARVSEANWLPVDQLMQVTLVPLPGKRPASIAFPGC